MHHEIYRLPNPYFDVLHDFVIYRYWSRNVTLEYKNPNSHVIYQNKVLENKKCYGNVYFLLE